jgi:hypothetical protein
MSDPHQEFADDVESALFLHGEDKETPSREGYLRSNATRWRLWPLISHALTYMLLMLASFELGRYLSANEISEKSLLLSQSVFSNGTTSIKASLHSLLLYVCLTKQGNAVSKKLVVFKPDENYNDDPFGPDGLQSAWSKLTPRTPRSKWNDM